MMIRNFLIAAAVTMAVNVNAKEENIDRTAKPVLDSTISTLLMANQLATTGLEQQDPLLLIASAKLYKLNQLTNTQRDKTSDGGKTTTKQAKPKYSAEMLLEQAEEWSGDNEAYAAIIDQMKQLKTRGRIGGGAEHFDAVDAGATDTYELNFYGRKVAEVAVIGDGDTDLDLHIYDEFDNSICEDTDSTDTTYCRWTPRFDGTFIIDIKNYGKVYNEYLLLTN